MQRVCSTSAKAQAETALVVFELKEDNGNLREENSRLLGEKETTCIIIMSGKII